MNTTENNKLIAEFMEFKQCKGIISESGKYFDYWAKENFSCIEEQEIQIESEWGFGLVEQDFLFAEQLKFHTDWNWLMPVIEKILDISLNLDTMEMYYNITDCIPNITQTHIAVTDFIKWYNENNK